MNVDNNKINDKINISIIELKNCEEILKQKYNISNNKKLIIFLTDYYINGLYIPIIDYVIFNPDNNKKLDLNYCINENINMILPVNINEENLFLYDPSNDYYNDNCFPYKTDNGTDIPLFDRKEEFNNNFSLCEKNCKYKEYNSKNKKVTCECKIKVESSLLNNITIDKDNLIYKFNISEKSQNSNILKCYYILLLMKA